MFQIINADCIVGLSALGSSSVDLALADPPYNIGVDYGGGPKSDRRTDYPEWCAVWIAECYRALRPGGALWVISGQEYGAHIDLAMQRAGFVIRNRITWHETFGVYCHNKFGRCSRPIFYGTKGLDGITFNKSAVTVPSARQEKYNDKRAAAGGKIMGDVWEISRVCGTFKERVKGVPTQLPETLVERIIGVSSNEGEVIVDPFSGSGTVCAVGTRMGRRCLGIELNPEYAEISRGRCHSQLVGDASVAP